MFRSAVFVALGSGLCCPQAFADLCLGARNEVIGSVTIDGSSTNEEWASKRPVAFKLDANGTSGPLFSTCAEDPAADSLVYVAPGASPDRSLYLLFDIPVLKNLAAPTAGQVVLSVHFPIFSGGTTTVNFVAVGDGSYHVDFQQPGGFGLVGAGAFGSSDNEPISHFMFELRVPLSTLPQNTPETLIWTSSSTLGPYPGALLSHFGITLDDLDVAGALATVPAFPIFSVPLAAQSLKKYVLNKLKGFAADLTKQSRKKLSEVTALLAKSLDRDLYRDEGRPHPKRGDKVFRYDKDAISALLDLLGKTALPACVVVALPLPNPPERTACEQLLVAIDGELARRAIDDFAPPGSSISIRANALLLEGDMDWTAGEVEAIDDFRQAWALVTP
jgi:hypothetical protein